MEHIKENGDKVFKKKKRNIFQRLSNSVSKYFHKSKISNPDRNGNGDLSKQCSVDAAVTSKSQDNLNINDKAKGKRKPFKGYLNIPKINDRCLSEGDLTREDEAFYSADSSPKVGPSGAYQSNNNESSRTESDLETGSVLKTTHSFKNELALRLKGKTPQRDNDSEHSKTPESPTGIETGTSPSRNIFNDTRTPRSMSSLSHSSNSLLSGNTGNMYGNSDGESMSRSVIDSHDDIGIVVDLATPISKTTTATLLDSTAARQKIAASKARRVRPKAIANAHSDKVQQDDSGHFSPVRDKRDILEEISEEDCMSSSNLPVLSEENSVIPDVEIVPHADDVAMEPSSDVISIDTPSLIDKMDILATETPSTSHPNETGDSPISVIHTSSHDSTISSTSPDDSKSHGYNLHKSKFQFDPEKTKPEKVESKFPVKLRPTGINNLISTGDTLKDHKADTVDSPEHTDQGIITHKPQVNVPDPVKVPRFSPSRPSKDTKSNVQNLPINTDSDPLFDTNKISHTAHNTAATSIADNRKSRVLSMLKNFEN